MHEKRHLITPHEVPTVAATTTATPMESPTTINFHQDSIGSRNENHQTKLGYEIQHLLDNFDELLQAEPAVTAVAMAEAMARMKDKFRNILVKGRLIASNSSSPYTDSDCSWYSQEWMNRNSEAIPIEAIAYLRAIAERMIAAGYTADCVEAYTSVRKNVVDERFRQIGEFRRLSSMNVRTLEWKAQQEKIRQWIRAATVCVNGLFADERMLTDLIFAGNNSIADDCFIDSVKDAALKLFNFAAAIGSSRRSPEKLFEILDLYEVISDLLPDIEATFGSDPGNSITKQAIEIRSTLSEAAQEILSEFEKAVFGDISNVPIPRGSVHPLTIYVMDYISSMAKYDETLMELIISKPSTTDYIRSSELDFDQASTLVLHLVWIIVALKANLEGKSKQYYSLFMTNNVGYIVLRIKASVELKEMIGEDYQNKLICLAEANYNRSTWWNRILDLLICGGLPKIDSL